MNNITAIILTKNEELKIAKTVKSLLFCDEVLVVDDESTDNTVEKANQAGARTVVHSSAHEFAGQRNWAMKQAKNEWILFVDADEQVSESLKFEISNLKLNDNTIAYAIPRRDFFWGTELKFGETKSARTNGILRLVKKDGGVWSGAVHETFIPIAPPNKLKNFIDHYSHETLSSFINDINYYSSIRAEELFKQGVKVSPLELIFVPFGKFIFTYFIKGGFLDGPAGFVYSFVMSFHSFLVRSKLATKLYV